MKRQPQPPLLRRGVLTSTVRLITHYALAPDGQLLEARRKIDITKEYEELAKRDRARAAMEKKRALANARRRKA